MTDPQADPDAVRAEIDTVLEDSDIQSILERVARDISREYDAEKFEDDQHRADLESTLAALRIASGRDRRAESVQTGRSSVDYEVAEVNRVRAAVRRTDPGDAFSSGGVRRNTDRHVQSTGGNS